jgi:hypothetical protein
LLLGLPRAFFLLLNCYWLAQIGQASSVFTEGSEENEDSILAFSKPLCYLRFLLLIGNQETSETGVFTQANQENKDLVIFTESREENQVSNF